MKLASSEKFLLVKLQLYFSTCFKEKLTKSEVELIDNGPSNET